MKAKIGKFIGSLFATTLFVLVVVMSILGALGLVGGGIGRYSLP